MNKTGKIINFVMAMLCMVGCEEKTIDFSYSPTQPRAGESVAFSNKSTTGEEWAWTFGDGGSSSSKSPAHVYKQPGQYVVTLKVDGKNSLSKTHEVTVYDTIPTFTSSIVDSIGLGVYEDVTFKALVYNPYLEELTYEWQLPEGVEYTLLSESMTEATLCVYFHQVGKVDVTCRIRLAGEETIATKSFMVDDVQTEGMLMRTADGDLRQRLYGLRFDEARPTTDAAVVTILDGVRDDMVRYNDSTVTLADLPVGTFAATGFAIANRKYYVRGEEGLYVLNMNGSYMTAIVTEPVLALCADVVDNRIYWATSKGVFYMPLVDTPNNTFTQSHTQLNSVPGVLRLAKDSQKR